MGRVTSEIHMLSYFGLLGKQKTPRWVAMPSGARITAVVVLGRHRLVVYVACKEMYFLYAHHVQERALKFEELSRKDISISRFHTEFSTPIISDSV